MSNATSEAAQPDQTQPADRSIPRVPWQPWLAVLFVAVVYFGSQIVSGTLVAIYPWLKHWSHAQALSWINNSVGSQFAYILLAEGLLILAIYMFLKLYGVGLASIGLKRPRWVDPIYGLAALPFYFLLYLASVMLVKYLMPGFDINQAQQLGFNNVSGSGPLVLTFVSLVVLPPLAEEIMVRGFLYSSLKKALPTVAAVLTTSAIFAVAHLPEGGKGGPLYIAALDTFVLSLVLIYLREKTGSLWPCITLHALKNAIAFVALFVLHFG